ncbi:hypothetical protein [Vulcanimicrobium alpinum]|nr:hypothetical protein [Vulcanimicrobium alpinum]
MGVLVVVVIVVVVVIARAFPLVDDVVADGIDALVTDVAAIHRYTSSS